MVPSPLQNKSCSHLRPEPDAVLLGAPLRSHKPRLLQPPPSCLAHLRVLPLGSVMVVIIKPAFPCWEPCLGGEAVGCVMASSSEGRWQSIPGDRTGLGHCSSGRVLGDAWSCGGGTGSSRRGACPWEQRRAQRWGHRAGAFPQGHDGEILAAALRPVVLRRFCKEPVLGGS